MKTGLTLKAAVSQNPTVTVQIAFSSSPCVLSGCRDVGKMLFRAGSAVIGELRLKQREDASVNIYNTNTTSMLALYLVNFFVYVLKTRPTFSEMFLIIRSP